MGKVKIEIYCFIIADSLTEMFVARSPTKPLNLIGCHGNETVKCSKHYLKINSSEAIREIKLKLHRIVRNISFYKNTVFIAIA